MKKFVIINLEKIRKERVMALKGKINEVPGNLFDYDTQGYSLVHCIGADYKMKDGIAKYFQIRYKTEDELKNNFFVRTWTGHGRCVITNNNGVCNLVVKRQYFNKPTLKTLREALVDMKAQCETRSIYKLAMPYIGCGIDGLDWNDVKQIIVDIFASACQDFFQRSTFDIIFMSVGVYGYFRKIK